jgi:hypothetical protein
VIPVDLPDGLYAVVEPRWVAGFIVRDGHVRTIDCAPILRRRLRDHWVRRARRIAD